MERKEKNTKENGKIKEELCLPSVDRPLIFFAPLKIQTLVSSLIIASLIPCRSFGVEKFFYLFPSRYATMLV